MHNNEGLRVEDNDTNTHLHKSACNSEKNGESGKNGVETVVTESTRK